jgi:hypothetical protein
VAITGVVVNDAARFVVQTFVPVLLLALAVLTAELLAGPIVNAAQRQRTRPARMSTNEYLT